MKEMQEELMDKLTGVYNRAGFYQATEELLAKNPDAKYIIAYWNVKRFKVINELFGREIGDAILKEMAEMIKRAYAGVQGTYGRMESDNFAACFPAELIFGSNREFVHSGDIVYVSEGTKYHFASCYGLYIVEDRSVGIESMVDRSRIAMDTVKDNYVKPYAYYDDSMRSDIVAEQLLMSEGEAAIKEEQFEVYYQPVCKATDGTITSAEALVRWRHPERGLISPDVFIPLFERNGFISVLDRYVWDKVCHMLKQRIEKKQDVVPISINVSRVDFYNQQLCEDIFSIIRKYDIEPQLLRLEITESAYSDNPQCVMETVKKLQEYGFIIMMDDFGSGYSSLNTLKDLPVDMLKIDMKFMDDLEKGGKSAIILESVVRMTKWMNLQAVAEGVETKEELNFLKSVECNYIQGYYFYKPMPREEFENLLNDPEVVDIKTAAIRNTGKDDFSVLYNESMKAEGVFQNMVGGLGIYELMNDRIEILRVNKGYYEIMKPDNTVNLTAEERLLSRFMPPEDYKTLLAKCLEAEQTRDTVQIQARRKRYDGSMVWLDAKIRYLGNKEKRKLFYFYIMDITRIKEAEQEEYRSRYSQALFRVFDKVYRLDYSTGYAEVLHSVDNSMKVGDKIYFKDFFDKFAENIEAGRKAEYSETMKNKAAMDEAFSKNHTGCYNIEYKVDASDIGFKWVSATFFKVEAARGEEEYLVCIKKI